MSNYVALSYSYNGRVWRSLIVKTKLATDVKNGTILSVVSLGESMSNQTYEHPNLDSSSTDEGQGTSPSVESAAPQPDDARHHANTVEQAFPPVVDGYHQPPVTHLPDNSPQSLPNDNYTYSNHELGTGTNTYSASTTPTDRQSLRPSLPGGSQQYTAPRELHGHSTDTILPDDSPDLLRWRADTLLDEMSLGSADGSATQAPGGAAFAIDESNLNGEVSSMRAPSNGTAPSSLTNPADGSLNQNFGHPTDPTSQREQVAPQPRQLRPDNNSQRVAPHDGGYSAQLQPLGQDGGQYPGAHSHSPTDSLQNHNPQNSGIPATAVNTGAAAEQARYDHSPLPDTSGDSLYGSQAAQGQNLYPSPEPTGQSGAVPAPQGYPGQPLVQSNLRQPTAAQYYPAPPSDGGYGAHVGQPGAGALPTEPHVQNAIPSSNSAPRADNYPQPSLQGQVENIGQTGGYQQHQHPPMGRDEAMQQPYPPANGAPNTWSTQPSFESGFAPQPGQDYQAPHDMPSQRPGMSDSIPPQGGRLGQDRNQQPLDPATYYAQQIAWRRELERKQWAISSGSSSDYLTSVPRYEEAQNRTASYYDSISGAPSWQNTGGYPGADYGPQGYPPGGYQQGGYPSQGTDSYSQGRGIHANPTYAPQLGPVNPGYEAPRQSNMPFAERMDVGVQAQRRSNLLPRRSQMSVDSLYEEMTVLQSQVDMALPIYGDSADRAMHLLEKGRTILEQNPERSAEVTYYVQQVSGIIQRGKQRLEWSDMYRSRLSRYLTAWLLLGVFMLLGSLAYSDRVIALFSGWFPVASQFFASHLPAILLVLAASIIGSSAAALVNMWRHSQKEYGFFDRKYGLLGVLLPLMGIVVSLAIYFLIAIIYLFLNLRPDTSWLTLTLPALIALLYAASQERIFGTSE